jgi:hypothetical protein
MAEQKRIEHSEYSYGQMISGPTEPREDRSKWHPKKLSEQEILKRYGWTQDDLRAVLSVERGGKYDFPRPLHSGLKFSSRDFWRLERVREWSETQIMLWEDSIRILAAKLPKKRD